MTDRPITVRPHVVGVLKSLYVNDYRNFISAKSQNTDNLLLLSLKDMDSILVMLVKLSLSTCKTKFVFLVHQALDYSPEDYDVEFLGI